MRNIVFWLRAFTAMNALDSISGMPAMQMAFSISMLFEEVATNIANEDGGIYDSHHAHRLSDLTEVEWKRAE